MANGTYAIKRYKVKESGASEFDKSVVIRMTEDQLTAIQGFISVMGGGLKLDGTAAVMYAISEVGEVDDIFVWSSDQ